MSGLPNRRDRREYLPDDYPEKATVGGSACDVCEEWTALDDLVLDCRGIVFCERCYRIARFCDARDGLIGDGVDRTKALVVALCCAGILVVLLVAAVLA